MSNTVDQAEVRRIGHLARLNLSDEEVATFAAQLSSILDYVAKLNELDVTTVEATAHPLPIRNVFADDVPHKCLTPEQALANAPDKVDGFFKVPKVLDTGEGA